MKLSTLAAASALALAAAVFAANPASAWDAANCVAKCQRTSAGTSDVQLCIAKNSCSQFNGPHESAQSVANGARRYLNGGGNAGSSNGPGICGKRSHIGGSPQLAMKQEAAGCFTAKK